ncbi:MULTISPECIES: hypothetical protein [unclassified Sporosarcina]|uniref:hypothetical protein n=1 Tax=unclassified Sporosarcina TaxID=2647733 RepID=UPI0020401FA8|nr:MULTISPECIES: hypothetical protein [unclassified Sporosarcina]GKV64839.1 hypothetical protein NCCP2331_09920 [Sporosarcina sp. NCCP-2331]GLB54949.1 hypothetical protein NCCP2378_07340 [Sporosarcina sp. NCCP-2378]
MIPEEVENRIAIYFLYSYLPTEIMEKVEGGLLTRCLEVEDDEQLDMDELVLWAIHVIDDELDPS